MVHIGKTKKGKFIVANIAKNGEILKVSETLNSKQAAWKNIKAELEECYSGWVGVLSTDPVAVCQDNTGKKPIVYLVGKKKVIANGIKPEKKYQPK